MLPKSVDVVISLLTDAQSAEEKVGKEEILFPIFYSVLFWFGSLHDKWSIYRITLLCSVILRE